jgi:hypothetical protein
MLHSILTLLFMLLLAGCSPDPAREAMTLVAWGRR